MSMTNLTVETGTHAVERLYSRLTEAQKNLVDRMREDKDLFIEDNGSYQLMGKDGLVVVLNTETVDKLLAQEFLMWVQPSISNIIRLNPKSWG